MPKPLPTTCIGYFFNDCEVRVFISSCLEWLCAAAVWIAVSDSLYSLTTRTARSSVRLTNHRARVINTFTRPTGCMCL